ncbi:MAG: glutamate--cysteine ligase [Cyanobacteriota bacterium]
MDLEFKSSKANTLGVEIELQIIDPETKQLAPGSPEILEHANGDPHIKQELFRSVIEINTDVCENIDQVRDDLNIRLANVIKHAESCGYELAGASTHPFSNWKEQQLFPDPRYHKLLDDIQYLARRMLTFGLHVHVGVDNPEKAIYINNSMLGYLPVLFALTTSGPYWTGSDSGLASLRPKIFETLPNAGLPSYLHCWHEYTRIIDLLMKSNSIQTMREIWWDIRPHPTYGTIEVRTCDVLPTIDETVALTALVQCLVAKLSEKYDHNEEMVLLPYMIIKENRWRVIRRGIDAELIDIKGNRVPVKYIVEELLEDLAEMGTKLNCTHELVKILDIIKNGTSSKRQRAVYQKTNSLEKVVESLIEELKSNSLCLV